MMNTKLERIIIILFFLFCLVYDIIEMCLLETADTCTNTVEVTHREVE